MQPLSESFTCATSPPSLSPPSSVAGLPHLPYPSFRVRLPTRPISSPLALTRQSLQATSDRVRNMPRLRILAGPSMSDLVPVHVDSGVPVKVSSDAFEGQLAVFIKGFADEEGKVRDSDYFRKRSGVTWSIQMQGTSLCVSLV